MIRLVDALHWRLARHALVGPGATSVADMADRVVATRAWPLEAAALTSAVRIRGRDVNALNQALESGTVVRCYGMRGGSFVMTPSTATELLLTRTATRIWETKRWQDHGGFTISDWRPLREAIRGMLEGGPMTRSEISHGLHAIPGRRSIRSYLHSYAPATAGNLNYWLAQGMGVPESRVLSWLADLGSEIASIDVAGVDSLALSRDADSIASARSSEVVRFLPRFDPWIYGPGTADARIIPAARRALASNGRPIVIFQGRAVATWSVRGHSVVVEPFDPGIEVPRHLLDSETSQLAEILNKDLHVIVQSAA